MDETREKRRLSFKEVIFLVVLVPLSFFLGLEVLCRVFSLDQKFSPLNSAMQLEMPTWMQKDENAAERASRASSDPQALEWLSMFEEAPGFRVRLIPNVKRAVTNTFSQIPFEKSVKYLVKANSIGFRSDEVTPEKAPGVFRILVFGDSSSFGWGVNQNESFSALLPDLLQKNNPAAKVEVANFAIPGDSSAYGQLIAENIIPKYKSDLVVLGFGANDAKKSLVSHTSQVDKFRSSKLIDSVQEIARYSALVRTLRVLLSKMAKGEGSGEKQRTKKSAVTREDYIENLKSMGLIALGNGAKNVLLLNLCTPGSYSRLANSLADNENWLYLNGQTRLLDLIPAISQGKIETDLVAEMRKNYGEDLKRDSLYYVTSDACHPNKLGHKLIAEELARIIGPLINK